MWNNVRRAALFAGLTLALCNLAAAQYGGVAGMGGGMPGSPTYNPNRSYASKAAIIGGVAGGAAVIGGLLYWHHHKQAKLQGCVTENGDKVVDEKDNQSYNLANNRNESLKSGQRVALVGKKTKNQAGEPTFEVTKLNKDLGMCTLTTAQVQ
jgi:hypothetical protein